MINKQSNEHYVPEDIKSKKPVTMNKCVAVWEKRRKDAKLVIEKIDQQIIKDS